MNIERQAAGSAPRLDKSTTLFARAGVPEGGSAATDGEPPSFAAVLTGLDTAAHGGTDAEPVDRVAPDATAIPGTAISAPAPGALPTDGVGALANGAGMESDGRIDAQLARDAQIDVAALRGWAPPIVPTGQPAPMVTDGRDSAGQMPGDLQPVGLPGSAPATAGPAAGPAQGALDAGAVGAGPQQEQQRAVPAGDLASGELANDNNAQVAASEAPTARAGVDTTKADVRAALVLQTDRVFMASAPVSDASSSGFKPLPALAVQRSAERVAGRSIFVPLEGSLAGSGAASVYSANAAAGLTGATGADAPFGAGASSDVAHQVHYWITRGAQNAELQLQSFGGGAVDVSISLRGNEAQVEFRSDQPEARRLLHDAMPQLRDLLQSEGLELSGGFVGGSADQERQQGRDDPRGTTARAAGVVAPGHTEGQPARSRAMQGHALDVFV